MVIEDSFEFFTCAFYTWKVDSYWSVVLCLWFIVAQLLCLQYLSLLPPSLSAIALCMTYSRRSFAEFTWSRLLRSPFHVHALPAAVLCWTSSCFIGTICNDRKSFPYAAGGAGIPPAGPEQNSRNLAFQGTKYSRKTQLRGSVSFHKMNLKEKIIHLMFQTGPMTRLHKYSQTEVENSKAYLALYIINIHQQLLKLYGCRSP